MRARIRYKHYSLRTEKAYIFWVRRFIRFHGLKHPRSHGWPESSAFSPTWQLSPRSRPSTHKQALAAVLFLYREVLGINLPWMGEIGRPRTSQHVPVVLSRDEVASLLACVPPEYWLMCSLMYGAGLRLQECLTLAGQGRRLLAARDLCASRQGSEGSRRDASGADRLPRCAPRSICRATSGRRIARPGCLASRCRGRWHASWTVRPSR